LHRQGLNNVSNLLNGSSEARWFTAITRVEMNQLITAPDISYANNTHQSRLRIRPHQHNSESRTPECSEQEVDTRDPGRGTRHTGLTVQPQETQSMSSKTNSSDANPGPFLRDTKAGCANLTPRPT